MSLSDRERGMLERAVMLRSIMRQLDAPYLHKLLNEEAEYLIALQREWAQRSQEMETMARCIEDFILKTQEWNISAANVVKRYRTNNPRKD